jgi:hypothetical protein
LKATSVSHKNNLVFARGQKETAINEPSRAGFVKTQLENRTSSHDVQRSHSRVIIPTKIKNKIQKWSDHKATPDERKNLAREGLHTEQHQDPPL